MKKYKMDSVARQRDPNLQGLTFDHGSFTSLAATAAGQAIEATLASRAAVAALVGAISAAPSRPSSSWSLRGQGVPFDISPSERCKRSRSVGARAAVRTSVSGRAEEPVAGEAADPGERS